MPSLQRFTRLTRSVERCSVVHPRVQVHVEMTRLYFRAHGPFFLKASFFCVAYIDQPTAARATLNRTVYFVTVWFGPTVSGPISAAGRLRPPSLPPAPFSGATTSVTTLAGSSEGSSSCRV